MRILRSVSNARRTPAASGDTVSRSITVMTASLRLRVQREHHRASRVPGLCRKQSERMGIHALGARRLRSQEAAMLTIQACRWFRRELACALQQGDWRCRAAALLGRFLPKLGPLFGAALSLGSATFDQPALKGKYLEPY
jgi:hypothetical protein